MNAEFHRQAQRLAKLRDLQERSEPCDSNLRQVFEAKRQEIAAELQAAITAELGSPPVCFLCRPGLRPEPWMVGNPRFRLCVLHSLRSIELLGRLPSSGAAGKPSMPSDAEASMPEAVVTFGTPVRKSKFGSSQWSMDSARRKPSGMQHRFGLDRDGS